MSRQQFKAVKGGAKKDPRITEIKDTTEHFDKLRNHILLTMTTQTKNIWRADNVAELYTFWKDFHGVPPKADELKDLIAYEVNELNKAMDIVKGFTWESFMEQEDYDDEVIKLLNYDFETDFDVFLNLIQYTLLRPYGERFSELWRQTKAGVLAQMTSEMHLRS